MARPTDRNSFQKDDAEARFPHHVDVLVPERGLGGRIDLMHDWCRQVLHVGAWAMHGHTVRLEGEAPVDYLRFYFSDESGAASFRARWIPD